MNDLLLASFNVKQKLITLDVVNDYVMIIVHIYNGDISQARAD
jgi:hypothetical protein